MPMISINSGQVHVWTTRYCDINDDKLLDRYHGLLNESERTRLKSFKFQKDRHQFLVTRALIKSVLSLYYTQVEEKNWLFRQNQYGKPAISEQMGFSSLKFNLAHTEGLAALAVSRKNEVGIDVEHLSRSISVSEIANRYFSERERSDLSRLSDDQKSERFFALWTLKESYLKAKGMGLHLPLDGISFRLLKDRGIDFSGNATSGDAAERWEFFQFKYQKAFMIALAINHPSAVSATDICCRDTVPLKDYREYDMREFRHSGQ